MRGWTVAGKVRGVIGKKYGWQINEKFAAYLNNSMLQLEPNFKRWEGPAFKEGVIRELSEVVEGGERLDGCRKGERCN